jgi:hypothetical protein
MRSWEHDLTAILRAKGCADFTIDHNGGGHITVAFRHAARIKVITVASSPHNESNSLNYFRQAVDRALGRGVRPARHPALRRVRRLACKPARVAECPRISPLPDWRDVLAPLLDRMQERVAV